MPAIYRPRRPKLDTFKHPASARTLIRKHLQADRYLLKDLAFGINLKPETLYKMFFDPRRPLSPGHIEDMITWLKLDEFDANELRLLAAREAGWFIDPTFLLKAQK